MTTQIERDPFARATLTRASDANAHGTCSWCGQRRPRGPLFRYQWEADSLGQRPYFDDGRRFCSVGCFRSYYGD